MESLPLSLPGYPRHMARPPTKWAACHDRHLLSQLAEQDPVLSCLTEMDRSCQADHSLVKFLYDRWVRSLTSQK